MKTMKKLPPRRTEQTEAQFLDEIKLKVSRVFLLAIHRHLYSFALRFLFLQTHATSYSFYSSVTVYTIKEKGGRPDRKPHPPSLWFKKIHTETSSLITLNIMLRNLYSSNIATLGRLQKRMKLWSKNNYIYRALPAEVILLSSSSFRRGFRRTEKIHRMLRFIK
jgi:hypothetical protein